MKFKHKITSPSCKKPFFLHHYSVETIYKKNLHQENDEQRLHQVAQHKAKIPSGQEVSKQRAKCGSGHKISPSGLCLQVNCHRRGVRIRKEKKGEVEWSEPVGVTPASLPPLFGQEYLSLLLFFHLQHHLFLHSLDGDDSPKVGFVCSEPMTGVCLGSSTEIYSAQKLLFNERGGAGPPFNYNRDNRGVYQNALVLVPLSCSTLFLKGRTVLKTKVCKRRSESKKTIKKVNILHRNNLSFPHPVFPCPIMSEVMTVCCITRTDKHRLASRRWEVQASICFC